MHDSQSVEAILSRLMPPALSEAGQRDVEAMLDDLAHRDGTEVISPSPRPRIRPVVGSIAAALALLAVVPLAWDDSHSSILDQVTAVASPDSAPFEWISESDRVEAVSDDGWCDSPEGSAMRAMRMRVVEEDRLLDLETGIVMRISEPRDELLLMPINAF
jgi:hypothetical protein